MELTKDVDIAGVTYQIGRFTARNGSWILAQVLTKILPSAMEGGLGTAALSSGLAAISEDDFASMQSHSLAVCRRYENGVPMPIFIRPNTWAVKELEFDLVAVMALTVHAMTFNLNSFFEGDGLSQILGSIPVLDLSSSPTQT